MTTEERPEKPAEESDSSEPTMLDHWRFERRVADPAPPTDWRAAVPAELLQRVKSRLASSDPGAVTTPATSVPSSAASAVEAGEAKLPETYRAPFLPEPVVVAEPELAAELVPESAPEMVEEPAPVAPVPAFQGLDSSWTSDDFRVLVSVRPVLDAALADRVADLLTQTPGMSDVHSLGSAGDIAAFEAAYRGEEPRIEAVSHALESIGASLVSTGDREFYLAIQGQSD